MQPPFYILWNDITPDWLLMIDLAWKRIIISFSLDPGSVSD